LESDRQLTGIIGKDDFFFLDRGTDFKIINEIKSVKELFFSKDFVISFKKLTNQFQVKTVIPHCRQSKKKTKMSLTKPLTMIKFDNEENNGDENDDDDDDESEQGKGNPKWKSKVQQPLTCIQSPEARICTKVRYVVERVFATLKKIKQLIE
jgi:hypothetical protein